MSRLRKLIVRKRRVYPVGAGGTHDPNLGVGSASGSATVLGVGLAEPFDGQSIGLLLALTHGTAVSGDSVLYSGDSTLISGGYVLII